MTELRPHDATGTDATAQSPLAIVGIGCLFPGAPGLEGYWSGIRNGVDAITDVPATHWKAEDYFDADPTVPDMTYARRGGFLDPIDFDPLRFGITPNSLEATDTTQLLALYCAEQALRDAGYAAGPQDTEGRPFDRERTSVILGVTGTLELVIPLGARLGHPIWRQALREAGVDQATADDVVERIADGYVPWQENSFPGLLGNVAAGRVANRLDLGGTNCVVDAACASSLSAIHLAAMELQAGRSDMAITGGVDTFNDIFMYMCFSKTPALSPTGHARPFSRDADGTTLGEGVGIVVLKRLEDARRDGDRIYCTIRGIGSSSDGLGQAIYAPSAAGQTKALASAYHESRVRPSTIELIEAHGTGTRVGDAVEASALADLYAQEADGDRPSWCALGSVKSMIGHTKAAAGAAGLIKAALALKHKVLPPTLKVDQPPEALEPEKAPVYVNTEARPWLPRPEHPRRAALSAFGFGGSNFHCVLEEDDRVKQVADWDGQVLLFAYSGDTPADIAAEISNLAPDSDWDPLRHAAGESRRRFNPGKAWRLTFAAERGRTDFSRLLGQARAQLESPPSSGFCLTPEGVCLASGVPGRLGVLFPGQGAQRVGMLRDLVCQFPQALEILAAANSFTPTDDRGQRLSDLVYPIPVFTDEARQTNEDRLRETQTAQPALGAVCLGAWRVLESFGVGGDAFAGHSFGELTALCAAGRLAGDDLAQLATRRGQLMAEAGGNGGMLAVGMSRPEVESWLARSGLPLVIANHNTPEQVVLSGARDAVEAAANRLQAENVAVKILAVSAAFHSPQVAAAARPLAETLAQVEMPGGRAEVYGNSTAAPYPTEVAAARDLLAGQLAKPVRFVEMIERMYADGVRCFLEVGPAAQISGLVTAILGDRDCQTIAVEPSKGKRHGIFDFAMALGQLAATGTKIHLDRWDPDFRLPAAPSRPGMSVRLTGANYVSPRTPKPPRPQPAPSPQAMSQPTPPPPSPAPRPAPADPAAAAGLQQSIAALSNLQEQTAQLHRQYLEGQAQAQETIGQLILQQHRLLGLPTVEPPATAPAVAPAPIAPVVPAPPAPVTPTIEAPSPPPVSPAPIEQAAPAPAPASPTPSAASGVLLNVVSEKTGYPAEMLELDMSLDTDLGIDSIKRVEILSALQEALPDAPTVKPEQLGTLQTLRQIVEFLDGGAAPAVQASASAPAPAISVVAEPATAATATDGSAADVLLKVVAEKTGYPAEMLELDMSLDTDLGIDSIKRVEILSALQEALPHAPTVKPEQLGTLQTLRQIVEFLGGGASPNETPPVTAPVVTTTTLADPAPAPSPAAAPSPLLRRLVLQARALNPETTSADARFPASASILVTDDDAGLAQAVCHELEQRGADPRRISITDRPEVDALHGLLILTPPDAGKSFLLEAFELVRHCRPALIGAPDTAPAFLAAATRLGGNFGLDRAADACPHTAGMAGLVKTAGHEWPEVRARVLDMPAEVADRASLAKLIAAELHTDGPAEIGLSPAGRFGLELAEQSLPTDDSEPPVQAGDLVIISGGARGVTAEVATALAQSWQPALLLLGRTPEPAPEPDWLRGLASEAEIKNALFAHGRAASPRALEEATAAVLAGREVRRTIDRLSATGASVTYRAVDVCNEQDVRAVVTEARERCGPVRGLIHAAGVLADGLIEHKSRDQFERVYTTKVEGLEHLLAATEGDPLRFLALFSSSTARFGRRGQADYAAANEILNKIAQREAGRRPDCRVRSLNWGPWDGGMVTPALKDVFRAEGVEVIPLAAGAEHLRQEISRPRQKTVETVVLGGGSIDVETGGPTAPAAGESDAPTGGPVHLAFSRELTVDTHPILRSHVIGDRAVLPAALMMEWLAHGALHDNPGLHFSGLDDLRIFKGVRLDVDESIQLAVADAPPTFNPDGESVRVELLSGPDLQTLHARAVVHLSAHDPPAPAGITGGPKQPCALTPAQAYADRLLFHGPDLQAIRSIEACDDAGIHGHAHGAPPPGRWMQSPLRIGWLADPLALDAAFQLMILWCQQQRGVASLPTALGHYRQYHPFPASGTQIVIHVGQVSDHSAVADIDWLDDAGQPVARATNYECVLDASLNQAFQRNQLAQSAPA